jgi:hypothetical protein
MELPLFWSTMLVALLENFYAWEFLRPSVPLIGKDFQLEAKTIARFSKRYWPSQQSINQ